EFVIILATHKGALERLADRPRANRKTISLQQYETLKQELVECETEAAPGCQCPAHRCVSRI
ncbi:MAG: hypothetical protein QF888_00720, partial [Desulfobacterales bacterium]|nr:hypothetical protein [Desulfobacterales bacterium]